MTRKNRHIPISTVKALDVAAEQIERAQVEAAQSKQPRFLVDEASMTRIFYQIYGWGKELIFNEPKYMPDSRRRDAWLAQVVTKEPYLLGVMQSCVSIDKNRGWTMTGGKIQTKRFVNMLHNFQAAPDLFGWRPGASVVSQSFYQSDLGGVVELGRAMDGGPLAALYTVDPTKCRLTGNSETPLQYAPGSTRGGTGYWTNDDFFRVVSFPNPNETMSGLGFCAVSRCIDLAKIVVSIVEHYKEKLGSKAPKGILTINGGGLTQSQWIESLAESKAELSQLEREYYSGVQVLVADRGAEINVSLTSLSGLPDQFDLKTTIDMIMFGYALAFGYDPREFWPVGGAGLGTGKETETQHRKATSKGGLDFALNFQEKLQVELPETIQFEFEERDVEGDIAEMQFQKAKWDIIDSMIKSVNANGEVTFTHAQMMELAVDAKLAKPEWTLPEENVEMSDTDSSLLTKERVLAAMKKYPDDDIVTYSSNTGKFRTIRKAGEEGRFMMRNAKPTNEGDADRWVSFGNENTRKVRLVFGDNKPDVCSCGDCSCKTAPENMPMLTRADVPEIIRAQREKSKLRYIEAGNFEVIRQEYWEVVFGAVSDYLESSRPTTSYRNKMESGVIEAFQAAAETAYMDGGAEIPLDDETQAWVNMQVNSERANVVALFSSLSLLRKEPDTNPINEGIARADAYANTLNGIYNQARIFSAKNKMLTFTGTDGEKSCAACQKYKDQRHRASWWLAHDAVPPTGKNLDCAAGGRCLHVLEDDDGNQVTV